MGREEISTRFAETLYRYATSYTEDQCTTGQLTYQINTLFDCYGLEQPAVNFDSYNGLADPPVVWVSTQNTALRMSDFDGAVANFNSFLEFADAVITQRYGDQ